MCLLSLFPFRHHPNPLVPTDTFLISLVYTDHTLRHAQLQCGAFSQPASAKAPKNSTWDILQHLQSPYKNFPYSFLNLFKATSRRSQMHQAQVLQDNVQCREARAGDLARPENLFFSTDPNLWSPLLSSQSQNSLFSYLPIPHATYSRCLVPSCSVKQEALSVCYHPNSSQPGVLEMHPARFQLQQGPAGC